MHYQRARLCQRSRAERVGGFGLREWLGKAESQGYQAFPPLIMSQPPVVYVLAEPGPNKELRDTGHLVGQQVQ